jgi:hypothetical protein
MAIYPARYTSPSRVSDMTDWELVYSDLRALHRAFRIHIQTDEWALPAEPMIVGTYNDTLAEARLRGVATAPEWPEFRAVPTYKTLFVALRAQLAFLELADERPSPGVRGLHWRVTAHPRVLPECPPTL